jgi:hypothetical protein
MIATISLVEFAGIIAITYILGIFTGYLMRRYEKK